MGEIIPFPPRARPRLVLPQLVNLPAEVAEMAALRDEADRAETPAGLVNVWRRMVEVGARNRAEVVVTMAAGHSDEDGAEIAIAMFEDYVDRIRHVEDDALAVSLIDTARLTYAQRLLTIVATMPPLGSA